MANKINIIILLLVIVTSSTSQTIKYIAPWGTDNVSSGTLAKPYKSIWYANNVNNGAAAITYKLKPGVYFETQNTNIVSYRTLIKDSIGVVIIDASNRDSSIAFKYMLGIVDVTDVKIDSIYFRNCIGQGVKGIYVLGSSKNIEISNCRFKNIGWTNKTNLKRRPPEFDIRIANAIRVQGTKNDSISNIKLIRNEIDSCATGIGEVVTITGNVSNFLIDSNRISRVSNIAIVAAGNYDTTNYVPNLALNQARNGTISNNEVSYCMSGRAVSAAIYLDGSLNCLVTNNWVHHSGAGISIGAEEPIRFNVTVGRHRIRNNIVESNSIVGIFIGSSKPGNVLKRSFITDNTIYKNTTAELINGVDSIGLYDAILKPVSEIANKTNGSVGLFNSDSSSFQNNIIETLIGRNALVGMTGSISTNFKLNFNLYYRNHNTELFSFPSPGHNFNGSLFDNVTFPNIPTFTTVTQQDSNSYFGNPKFINANGSIFRLDSCSAAIDRGNPIYDANINGTLDYYNNSRRYQNVNIDIGAAEFQGPNNPCVFNLLNAIPQCNGTTPEIKINWSKSNNANSYNVYLNTTASTPLNSGLLTDTFFVHSPVLSGISNNYIVQAINNSGNTNSSNNLSATAVCPTGGFTLNPLIPQCNGIQPQIRLNWTASINATSYEIHRSTGGPVTFYVNAGNVLTYTDNVNYGITYSYQVKAINSIASSFNSNGVLNQINKICKTGSFTLDSVVGKCSTANLSYIQIKTSASLNATSYSIFRKTGNILPDIFYKNISVPTSTGLVFNDSFVTPGNIYSYRIKAKNDFDSAFHTNSFLFDTALNCTPTSVFYLDNNKLEIKINPNPVTNQVRLSINASIAFPIKSIQLINSDGKMITSISINTRANNFTKLISCTNLPAGTYYLQIIFDNKKNVVIPFVKL